MAKFDVTVSLGGYLFGFKTVSAAREFLSMIEEPAAPKKHRAYKKRKGNAAAKKTTRKPRKSKAPKDETAAA